MIGVESIEPKTPPLEIENVPPVSSSSVSLPSLARLPNSAICFSISRDRHLVGVAQDRHHQAALGAHGDADVVVAVVDDVIAVDRKRSRPGYFFSAWTAAFTKNDMKPSFTPCSFSNLSL